MRLTALCRWVCSVPDRITRNIPFFAHSSNKICLGSADKFNRCILHRKSEKTSRRFKMSYQAVPSLKRLLLHGPSSLRPAAPVPSALLPSGSTINTLITILTNFSDPTLKPSHASRTCKYSRSWLPLLRYSLMNPLPML